MPLPAQLSRSKKEVHKNTFGHVLILAGCKQMLGAAILASQAAMRSGAGLVTLGIPKSLNQSAQQKISPVVMTWPLPETRDQTISFSARSQIKKNLPCFQSLAIGPGLSKNPSTQKLVIDIIENCKIPVVIDADALTALSKNISLLEEKGGGRILTPHVGEMARLTGSSKKFVQLNRKKVAKSFTAKYPCTLLLKGSRTIVASRGEKTYINKTGNAGLATAGSGDVLTGIIAAFLAQGLSCFQAAKWGAFIHGKSADIASAKKTRIAMISTDIIENLPKAFKQQINLK